MADLADRAKSFSGLIEHDACTRDWRSGRTAIDWAFANIDFGGWRGGHRVSGGISWAAVAAHLGEVPNLTLLLLLVIAIFALLFHARYSERVVAFGPTLLTTLGIFGTFLGLALGLSDFDANNVQASVPTLLAGMKTAFYASVAGVGAALSIKMRHYWF